MGLGEEHLDGNLEDVEAVELLDPLRVGGGSRDDDKLVDSESGDKALEVRPAAHDGRRLDGRLQVVIVADETPDGVALAGQFGCERLRARARTYN